MRNSILFAVTTLLFAHSVSAKQADAWRVKSTERQFEQVSAVIEKRAPSDLAVMSKVQPSINQSITTNQTSGDTSQQRQTAYARILNVRPQVNTLEQGYWLYDASLILHADEDRDGFFNHFTLEFDADTEFSHAEVYARLYLAKGEVFKEYHSTSNFNIYGDNDTDSFVVESELLTGFPTADYEILIELYDAYTDQLVATMDGTNDADLYIVPLESEDFEEVYVDQVVVIHESGGSLLWLVIFLLPLFIIRRLIQRP